jgi:predicted peptidase
MRMAIDVNHHLRSTFNIDPQRVHVSGFSGGGRVSSMLGVCYADMFPRTIPFMGVNYYKQVPGKKDQVFNPSYIPDEQVLLIAQRNCRYVLVTGEKDFNRVNTKSMFEHGFQKDGFRFVRYYEVPKIAHTLPRASHFDKILELAEGR